MDGLKSLNLLFLEDNEEFATNTMEFLNLYFKQVYHSPTIQNAMKLFDDYKIDVIFSDIKVQDGNGLTFIEAIREKNREIPIVILSAHKDESFLFKAIPLHITSYELKPLRYDAFIALLQKIADIFTPASQHLVVLKNGLCYDFRKKDFVLGDTRIKLANQEILFVELMLANSEKIVTTDMIQRNVWQEKTMSDSALKNLLFRLRKKVGYEFITTVQCLGYKLNH